MVYTEIGVFLSASETDIETQQMFSVENIVFDNEITVNSYIKQRSIFKILISNIDGM